MKILGSICVAGYQFGFYNQSELPIVFETGFEDFFSENIHDFDYTLVFKRGFISTEGKTTLYQAKNGDQLLWEIAQHQDQRLFLVYHPEHGTLQQQALYDSAAHQWTILSEETKLDGEEVLNPLAYPMAPLIWYVLSTEKTLLLIHASGIHDGQLGRVFAGFSGVGKSTMAGIWEGNGATVINDDRLILKQEKNGSWHIHNTPMYYRATPKSAPLHALYLPYHHPINRYQKIVGAQAIAHLLAFTIHHGFDPEHVLHHSTVAERLLKEIPIAKLGVVPTTAIIDFIKLHD